MSDATEYYNKLEKEQIKCPVCNSKKYLKISKGDRYGMGLDTCGCKNCGLLFINPRPTKAEMDNFYATNYRKYYESVEHPSREYVANGPFIPRADFVVEKLIDHLDVDAAIKFLDIGCAEGTLLKTIGEKFPNAVLHGIEPDPNFGEYARQTTRASIITGDFEELLGSGELRDFDVVTFTHVLEHILDPHDFLQRIKKVMKPDALCYVEVPNIHTEKTKGRGHIHLGHVLSLSPQNLKWLLVKNGFSILAEYLEGLPAKTPAMAYMLKNNAAQALTELSAGESQSIIEKYKTDIAEGILVESGDEPKSFWQKLFS